MVDAHDRLSTDPRRSVLYRPPTFRLHSTDPSCACDGCGLFVGGKGAARLAQVEAELEEYRESSNEQKLVIENLVARSERLEAQYNEMRAMFLAFQKQTTNGEAPTQPEGMEQVEKETTNYETTTQQVGTEQVEKELVEKEKETVVQGKDVAQMNIKRAKKDEENNIVEGVSQNKDQHQLQIIGSKQDKIEKVNGNIASQDQVQKAATSKKRTTTAGLAPNKDQQQLQVEITRLKQVKIEKVNENIARQDQVQKAAMSKKRTAAAALAPNKDQQQMQTEITRLKQVEIEKVNENIAKQEEVQKTITGKKRTTTENKTRKNQVPQHKETEGGVIKGGMEVGLTSPNSEQLVAPGTIQPLQNESMGLDGEPLSGFVKVLINIVLKSTTSLPHPQGRVTNIGSAQALCIPWPCKNVTKTDGTQLQTKVSTFIDETTAKRAANSQAMRTIASKLKTAGEKTRKKNETSSMVASEIAE